MALIALQYTVFEIVDVAYVINGPFTLRADTRICARGARFRANTRVSVVIELIESSDDVHSMHGVDIVYFRLLLWRTRCGRPIQIPAQCEQPREPNLKCLA